MALPAGRARRLLYACALLALSASIAAAVALGALPQQSGNVDLNSHFDVKIAGAAAANVFGEHSDSAGDFNGDGFDDEIVSNEGTNSASIIFGRPTGGTVDLLSPGTSAIKISGANAFTLVAGAGDVNGDGIDDVILGDPGAAGGNGAAWVVFGSKTPANVDVTALGTHGFEFDGAANGDEAGAWVDGVGDMNNDGKDDVVIGAFGANGGAGAAYVVFGSASTSTLTAGALGSRGFEIDGDTAGDAAGSVVAGGGDINGDGVPDVLVGAPGGDYSFASAGAVYAVFGKSSTTAISLHNTIDAASPTGGFRIDGAADSDQLPRSLAIAGDMNHDGKAEAAVGTDFADNPSGADTSRGSVWVVFGKASTSPVTLNATSATLSGGFRIDGQASNNQFARSLGPAGDVNGDGVPDIVAGALFADNNGRSSSGSLYVIFGRSATTTIDTNSLGSAGFRIDGAKPSDSLGRSANGAGDFNGDGRADVIGGAEFNDPSARTDAGAAYVTYGFGTPSFAYSPTSIAGTLGTPIAPLSPSGIKRTGPASFAVSPVLPNGLSLDPATGTISGAPGTVSPDTAYTVTMTDLAGHATATVNIHVDLPVSPSGGPGSGSPPPPTLKPGACANKKTGTRRADHLTGTKAGDLIHGGAGNDTINGLAGADCLYGDAGNDKITGGPGRDKIYGGPGNDTINAADHKKDTVNCGKGKDRVKADKIDKLIGCEKVKRVR